MDKALLRHTLGMPVYNEKEMASEEEYKKIVKSFEGQDDESDDDRVEVEEDEYRADVRKTLAKLLLSHGWIKGYVTNIMKELQTKSSEKEAIAIIKDEVEQSILEMVHPFKVKFKIK